jgi:hypothetical protein
MKSLSSTLLLLAVPTIFVAQHIDCVYSFASDIDTLSPAQYKEAEDWAASHYHFRHDLLEIRGHTDQDADDDYNEALSMRRAKHLEAIFKRIGFDQIRLSYYGEKVPLCNELDEVCHSKNRRVEIILYNTFDEKWMTSAHLEAPEVFFFDATKSVTIAGEGGTKIHVGMGTLRTADGRPYFGKVRVELREILSPLDCIHGGISTMSNGALIETGGMCELQMYASSTNALLELSAPIEIQFPSQSASMESGMQTFVGRPSTSGLNWEAVKWSVQEYDLKWYSVMRIRQNQKSDWYPSGFGAPGTERQPDTTYVYKCDTIRLSKEQIAAKKQRMSRGERLVNSIRVQNLGWINCDRFIRSNDAVALRVESQVPMDNVYVIFNDRRVVLYYQQGSETRIPQSEAITIVSMGDAGESGLVPFSIVKTSFSGEKIQVVPEYMTIEVIEERMAELSSLWL